MTRLITGLLVITLLAGCGGLRESRLNPFNWFGRDKEERIAVVEKADYVGPRGLVGEVLSLKVDRLPGGAIINAMGLPPTQGYWSADLVPLNGGKPDKGTLVYEFRLAPPPGPEPVGEKRSREVLTGLFVSDQDLAGVRRITVLAERNKRTVRR